jgi:hypothetical protein
MVGKMVTRVRIVFTASNTIGGRIIRWLTHSDVSHVMLQYPSDLWGGDWVAEAMVRGVIKRPAEKARKHVVKEYVCRFNPKPGLQTIRKYVGESFDFEGVLIAGWLIALWHFFKVKIKAPLHSVKSAFCSEFITRFLMTGSLPPPKLERHNGKWNLNIVSPEDIDDYCAANPEWFDLLDK